MKRGRSGEDALMRGLVGSGSSRGSTWFGRAGDIVQQPPVWAGVAAALALGGPRGRRAALRGSVCYTAAALAQVLIKPIVARGRPPGSGKKRVGPITSSFPSGHAASDLGFALAAAQELPLLLIPLSGATMAAHWSLVRSRGHYVSDVLAGGALGVAVALLAWKLWPPGDGAAEDDRSGTQPSHESGK
jgi:membrane-associated phospholipid phosphatase